MKADNTVQADNVVGKVHFHGGDGFTYTDCMALKDSDTLVTRALRQVTCRKCQKSPTYRATLQTMGIDYIAP
jgi:hypothetical protein